jgi:hypothetical protein
MKHLDVRKNDLKVLLVNCQNGAMLEEHADTHLSEPLG